MESKVELNMLGRRDRAEAKRILKEAGWSSSQIEGVLKPEHEEQARHEETSRTGLRKLFYNFLKDRQEDKISELLDTDGRVEKTNEGVQHKNRSIEFHYYPSKFTSDIENLISSEKILESASLTEQIDRLCSSPKIRRLLKDNIQKNYLAIVVSIDQTYKSKLKYKDLEIKSCYQEIDDLKDILESAWDLRMSIKKENDEKLRREENSDPN